VTEAASAVAETASPPKAAAPTPKKDTKPKKETKGSVTAADQETAKRLSAARAAILKFTGKKNVEVSKTSMPAVSSGSFLLDHLIGGTLAEDGKAPLCPGYPRRYITELYGAEASGKTTAGLEAVAEVQKLSGGSAMYLDFEHSLNQKYARSIGVQFRDDKLMFFQPDTMEEGWKMFVVGLKAGVDLIVIDSVAAMTPKDELEKDLDKAAKVGAQASNLSNNLKKVMSWLHNPKISSNPKGTAVVLINQTRAVISTGGPARGDNESTAGGKALKFYAHLRVKFTKIRGEFIKRKNKLTGKEQSYQYGNHTQAKIIKSRIDGTAGHTTDIFIRYGQGIDNYYSLLEAAVSTKIVQRNGATNKYGNYVAPSKDKFRDLLINNPALYEEIRLKTLAAVRDTDETAVDEEDEIMELMEGNFGGGDDDDAADSMEAAVEEIEAADFTESDASEQESASE
jgi:recombination protein RecA